MLYPLKFRPRPKDDLGAAAVRKTRKTVIPGAYDRRKLGNFASTATYPSSATAYWPETYRESLGRKCYYKGILEIYEKFGLQFPLLIKYIDAQDKLSVQVHPDDALAAKRYGGYGKSEMWYVLDCDPGAELYLGFDGDVSRERYAEHVERGTLPEILSRPKVSPGDAFFIPAGTIHAIGKGILLAEIQQASDVTYRIYDWGRTDASGKGRELHTDLAADAIRFDNDIPYRITAEPRTNEAVPLKRSPYFTVNLIGLDGAVERNHVERDSFVVYMLTEGRATLGWEGGSETVKKGETLLVPACIEEVTLTGQGKLLEIYIE